MQNIFGSNRRFLLADSKIFANMWRRQSFVLRVVTAERIFS